MQIPEGIPPWRAVLYDGYSVSLAEGAETFFRVAIEPACRTIALELERTERGPDDAAFERWDEVRQAQLELHRSFALALGAQWERHFSRHLWHSAAVIGPKTSLDKIEGGGWDNLVKTFQVVRGFSMSKFASYSELELLYQVTTVVRHGNGNAAKKLFKLHAELFSHEPIHDFFSYFTLGGEPKHSIHRLDISLLQLQIFKDAIVDFWRTIRALQASSVQT